MNLKPSLFYVLLLFPLLAVAQESPPEQTADAADLSEEAQYLVWAAQTWESLDRQTGEIMLPDARATLTVPENFYYLNPTDAQTVLVDIWGNPPSELTHGMLFPADMTPFDTESWAVTIEYEEDGYVSDDDADEIDYSDLLKQMQEDTRYASKERVKQGYPAIELVGWAAQPYYDAASHKLYWAKEISFEGDDLNTLNYNIRVLGRKGVLVLNFIAGMDQKTVIDSNLDTVLAMAEFNDGARYGDFNPDIDQVAAYGLGALVAGKVLTKAGFFALILVFLKKFGVFIVVGAAALMRGIFGGKKDNHVN